MAEATAATSVAEAEVQQTPEADSALWRARIERCKRKRKELAADWSLSVDYRLAKPFAEQTDRDRVAVAVDWAQTKAKQAQLFSQMPQVVLLAKDKRSSPAIPVFAKELNDTLTRAKVGVAMDECLPDVINAAGVAAVVVGYEARTVPKVIPRFDSQFLDPALVEELMADPTMVDTVEEPVDARIYTRRLSPTDLLWPVGEFRGSNFDDAPWLGQSGRMHWAEAKVAFKLDDAVKEDVIGGRERAEQPLNHHNTNDGEPEQDIVEFDEIYYWAHLYDPECLCYSKIMRMVFVKGIDAPVVNEPWSGQREVDGKYIGALKFPIRVLTLTYISDEPIPPSDSAIGRAQVDELIRFRSQIIAQRDYTAPMRWFDVNRVDPDVMDSLMKGTWQGMIPTNGDGTRVIGEVARASFPKDDPAFDAVIKKDLQESWQIGPNQVGTFNQGERSASEAQIVQANFSTRIGYERARCGAFVCGIAEVVAGLLVLFGDFSHLSDEDKQRLATWQSQSIANDLVYSIRTDSTVLLDSNQRIGQLMQFLNMTGKSGYVDVEPIMREIASLSGVDPDTIIRRPAPKPPEAPSTSFSFKGEDLGTPMVIAMLIKSGQAPTPEELMAAQKLLLANHQGAVLTPDAPPVPPASGGPGGAPGDGPQPAVMDDRMPHWQMGDKINTRRENGSL